MQNDKRRKNNVSAMDRYERGKKNILKKTIDNSK